MYRGKKYGNKHAVNVELNVMLTFTNVITEASNGCRDIPTNMGINYTRLVTALPQNYKHIR